MSRITVHLICILATLISCSALYYLCLILSLPLLVFLLITILLTYAAARLYFSLVAVEPLATGFPLLFSTLAIAALVRMLWMSRANYEVYGGWDAYAMWNYHARFLSDPENWKLFYRTATFDHPDYPLSLPSIIAPFWRIMGSPYPIVPLMVSLWVMIAAPLSVAANLHRRNALISIGVLVYFCTSEAYLNHGIFEQADTLLGALFAGCFITLNEYRDTSNRAWLILCGACAAGAAWTKNEGIVLCSVFFLFHVRLLFKRVAFWPFIGGALLPLTALIIHKAAYAPANDLISGTKGSGMRYLLDKQRLVIILRFFKEMMWEWFRPVVYILAGYAIWCIWRRQLPARILLAILACLICYMAIYMMTPYSLEWHLRTSFDRLILQLIPALLYGIGLHLSGKGLSCGDIKNPSIQE